MRTNVIWALAFGQLSALHAVTALLAPLSRIWKRRAPSSPEVDILETHEIDGNTVVTSELSPPSKVPPDVAIRSLDDLPSIPSSCTLQVYYAEQIIQELGTVGELVETYHSGILFRVKKNQQQDSSTNLAENDIPSEFTIQWYALDFPFGAFLPKIGTQKTHRLCPEGHHLEWNNTAFAHYTPGIDPDRWTKGEQLVGSISGGQPFADFCQWTLNYCQARPGYQAFEVWDQPILSQSRTKRWAESNTCSSFTEAALIKLYELGAQFGEDDGAGSKKQLLRRSYVPLISKTKPTVVDMQNAAEVEHVNDFYAKIQTAVMGDASMTTSEFIRFLADKLDFFYVYDAASDEYLRVTLNRPYLALANLYQPMTLPWQDRTEWEKAVVMDSIEDEEEETGLFSAELTAAVGGVRDLVKRRLPDIVTRRLPSSLSPAVLLGAAMVLVLPLGFFIFNTDDDLAGILNESFISGLIAGLVTGVLVPRLLPSTEKDSSFTVDTKS